MVRHMIISPPAIVSFYGALPPSVDAMRALAKAGASVSADSGLGMTPLHWACTKGRIDLVRELLTYPDVGLLSKTISGNTPLMLARLNQHAGVVRELRWAGSGEG